MRSVPPAMSTHHSPSARPPAHTAIPSGLPVPAVHISLVPSNVMRTSIPPAVTRLSIAPAMPMPMPMPMQTGSTSMGPSASLSQPPHLPDSVEELHKMVLAQRKTIAVLSKQMAKRQSEHGSALDHLRQNRLLEDVVQRKTNELNLEREKLHVRNRDMRLLLDNVAEGFLTVDATGTISTERSAAVNRWLGADQGNDCAPVKLWDYIGRADVEAGLRLELTWQLIADEILSRDIALAQFPTSFQKDGTQFRVAYREIQEDSSQRLLVVITDVTLQLEKEKTEERERDISHAVEHAVRDRHGFFEFLDEADGLIEVVVDASRTRSPEDRLRALHTLKGNCTVYGFASFARMCHEQEDREKEMDPEARDADPDDLMLLAQTWERFTRVFRDLGGGSNNGDKNRPIVAGNTIEIEREDLESLAIAIEGGIPRQMIARQIRELTLDRLGRRLDRLGEMARQTASRLNKEVEIAIDDAGVRIDSREWSPFILALSHIVRNAVDHGIESPEERARAGKPRAGQLTFVVTTNGGIVELRMSDDGRGIDWEAVRERASALGQPAETRDDLCNAILSHGFSTRDEASELSGRGVGLDAVVRAVAARDGTLSVSEGPNGIGTTFVVRVRN